MRPRLDQQVPQRRRLDRARHHRTPARVRGELAQQRVPRTAADDVDDLDGLPGEPLGLVDGLGERRREVVEDAPDDLGRALRDPLARLAAGPHDAARHVARLEEGRVGQVDPRARREGRGRVEEVLQVELTAAQVPPPDRLRQEPEPHDVAQVADGAVDAALVGEVGPPAVLGQHGRIQLDADERPRPAGDVAEVRAGGGHADDRRRGVVRADGGEQRLLVRPQLLAHGRRQRRQDLPGGDDLGQQPGGQAQRLDQLRRPEAGAGVDEAGGGGDRLLGGLAAGQPVAEQVRDQEEAVRVLEVGFGRQLVDAVDRDDLQPADGVEPRRVDLLVDLLDRRLAARVAVGVRVAPQRAVRVEQAVVDAPGVDGQTGQHVGLPHRAAQAGDDVLVEPEDVPVHAVGQPDRAVAEPVDLGQLEGVGPDPAEHDPPAGRPEVDRGERSSTHRRNAAATPESTGTCRPVVCDRSPPVSAKTASATCSGSTSRPSRVRLA